MRTPFLSQAATWGSNSISSAPALRRLIDGNLVEPGGQRIIAAHVAHTKTWFFDSGQIAVHDKAVVGVVLERAQIERGGLPPPTQQDMAQTQPLAAAGAVYPAQDHTLDHDACRAEDVEQRQYDTE